MLQPKLQLLELDPGESLVFRASAGDYALCDGATRQSCVSCFVAMCHSCSWEFHSLESEELFILLLINGSKNRGTTMCRWWVSAVQWSVLITNHFHLGQNKRGNSFTIKKSKKKKEKKTKRFIRLCSLASTNQKITHFISDKHRSVLRLHKLWGLLTGSWFIISCLLFFSSKACSFGVNTLTLHKLITSEADGSCTKGVVFLHSPVTGREEECLQHVCSLTRGRHGSFLTPPYLLGVENPDKLCSR